eukprot:767450-Hanusia_phi.AAC.2
MAGAIVDGVKDFEEMETEKDSEGNERLNRSCGRDRSCRDGGMYIEMDMDRILHRLVLHLVPGCDFDIICVVLLLILLEGRRLLFNPGSKAESTIRRTGSVKKNFEKSVKGYVLDLEGGRDVKVQLPLDDKQSLGILHQFIVLQVRGGGRTGFPELRSTLLQLFVPAGKGFSVEMTILDQSKTRRRMNLSCNNKEVSVTPLHVRLPLDLVRRGMWVNLCIDAAGLFHESFGPVTRISEFWCLESLSVSATCRLRRIFSVKESLVDTSMDTDDLGDASVSREEQSRGRGGEERRGEERREGRRGEGKRGRRGEERRGA